MNLIHWFNRSMNVVYEVYFLFNFIQYHQPSLIKFKIDKLIFGRHSSFFANTEYAYHIYMSKINFSMHRILVFELFDLKKKLI